MWSVLETADENIEIEVKMLSEQIKGQDLEN